MIVSKSFIDLLFILLCGTIALLSQSLYIGPVDTGLLKMGKDKVGVVRQTQNILPVIIKPEGLVHINETYGNAEDLAKTLTSNDCVLLISGDDKQTHHQVMGVWSQLKDLAKTYGFTVKLGAQPVNKADNAETEGD